MSIDLQGTRIEVTGDKEAVAALEKVSKRYLNRIIRTGLEKIGAQLDLQIRQLVPKRTHNLERSLGYHVRSYNQNDYHVLLVGARHGYVNPESGLQATRYHHLAEMAVPHMRPVWDTQKAKVIAEVELLLHL